MITTQADELKRAIIPMAVPGQVYDVQANSDGSITLMPVPPETKTPKFIRMEKRGRYHVGVLDGPLDEFAIKQLLADFP